MDVGVDDVAELACNPLLLPPPKLGVGEVLLPDLLPGESGCWFPAVDEIRGLLPPLFGDKFLVCSDAVATANIACCCFKACSAEANNVEAALSLEK